jgi:ferredoxin
MPKLLVIDEEECQGCESCVELCPEAFEFDEDRQIAIVKNLESDKDCIQEAIDSCPVECIRWEEE